MLFNSAIAGFTIVTSVRGFLGYTELSILYLLHHCNIWVGGKGMLITVPHWRRGNSEPDVSSLALIRTDGFPTYQQSWPSSLRLSKHCLKSNGSSHRLKSVCRECLAVFTLPRSLQGRNMVSPLLGRNLGSQRSNDLPKACGHTGSKS